MTIKLRDFGSSFATRERAREVIMALPGGHASSVDLDGVLCSPSFLAEFLSRLTVTDSITVTTNDPGMADKIGRLTVQLGLGPKVKLNCAVSA